MDALILGRAISDQILGWDGDWPYPGKPVYVLSRTHTEHVDIRVQFVDELPELASHVWLVGGAQAIHAYAEAGRIGEWIISIIPTLLGRGIALFPTVNAQQSLSLVNCRINM